MMLNFKNLGLKYSTDTRTIWNLGGINLKGVNSIQETEADK